MILSSPTILLSDEMDGIREYCKTRASGTMTVLFCVAGSIDVEINNKIYHVGHKDMYVRLPAFETVFGKYEASPDFRFCQITFSESVFDQLMLEQMRIEPRWWDKQQYIKINPIIHLSDAGVELFNAYYRVLVIKMQEPESDYRRNIIKQVASAASMEVLCHLDQEIHFSESNIDRKSISQSDYLFHQFMRLLQIHPYQREVQWFAEQMNITPKYLSEISKSRSGQSASEWISQITVAEIKRYLRYSTLPIYEIAERMQFPNTSFFCQYTKKHTGLTPNQIRNRKSNID